MPTADPNAYGSSWYATTAVASPARGRLTIEADVDVCVIGAGLAGLTVAREVARRGWSVLVLESQRVAWNASGRNSGFVLPGFAASPRALVARVGLDHAKELWSLSEAGAEYVRAAARETPGAELSEDGWLQVSKTDRDGEIAAEYDLLGGQLGAARIEIWTADRVREALPSRRYFDALYYPSGFSVHPLNYALGLAAGAEASGARICEETPALEIDPAGVRKRIATPNARVRAGHVVFAGNVHLAQLMPDFAGTLLPEFAYGIATAPLGQALREVIRFPGIVSDSGRAGSHYRVTDQERLIWSGGSTVWHGRPQRYVNSLLREIRHTYPQLGKVRAEYAWTGAAGSTVHGMPQIGEISPGLWLLSGFGRHGLNTTAMGGELIARAIVEGDRTWQLFQPFEMIWAGGRIGRTVQQTRYWSSRTRQRIGGWIARRRDVRRRGRKADVAAPIRDHGDATIAPVGGGAVPAFLATEVAPQPPEIVEAASSVVPEPLLRGRLAAPQPATTRRKSAAGAADGMLGLRRQPPRP
jgi:gamma-glutamylputrescine oxidase